MVMREDMTPAGPRSAAESRRREQRARRREGRAATIAGARFLREVKATGARSVKEFARRVGLSAWLLERRVFHEGPHQAFSTRAMRALVSAGIAPETLVQLVVDARPCVPEAEAKKIG